MRTAPYRVPAADQVDLDQLDDPTDLVEQITATVDLWAFRQHIAPEISDPLASRLVDDVVVFVQRELTAAARARSGQWATLAG